MPTCATPETTRWRTDPVYWDGQPPGLSESDVLRFMPSTKQQNLKKRSQSVRLGCNLGKHRSDIGKRLQPWRETSWSR